jgi:acetyl esterase/lipase
MAGAGITAHARDTGAIDVGQWAGFGFVAMSIDYRLVTCSPAPACYQDMLCAIRWVHANAATYGIDADQIFLIGMSAGGHMVSLAATLGNGNFPLSGGWDDFPASFLAAISVSGTYDLVKLDWGAGWVPPGEPFPLAREYASPIRHVGHAATAAAFRRRPIDPDRAGPAHGGRVAPGRRASPVRALPGSRPHVHHG